MEIKLNSAHMGTIEEAARKYDLDAEELAAEYKYRVWLHFYDGVLELAAELAKERS